MRWFALATVALAFSAQAADEDRGFLAGLISRALSSHTTQVSIGAVDGALSSDATVRDIVLSDRDGPWLKINRARLVWSRLALFKRRLEIDKLEIDKIVWSRPAAKSLDAKSSGGAIAWPDLPLKAIVKDFSVASLDLGEPILGAHAELSFAGAATLGSPAEGLDLNLIAKRLDAPGAIQAKLAFAPKSTQLSLALDAEEPQGGLLARVAKLPGAPPVAFRLDGAGPLDAFHAKLDFAAGPDIGAKGGVDLARNGAARRLRLDLDSRVAGLLPAMAASVFAGETKLSGDVLLGDDGALNTQGVALESDSAQLDVVGGLSADNKASLSLQGRAKPGPDIGKLDLSAEVSGTLPRPSAKLALDVENLKSAQGALGGFHARFAATPDRPGDAASFIALTGDADMEGLALADPAQTALVGSTGRLTLRAVVTPDSVLDVSQLRLDADALHASFAGKAGQSVLDGQVSADADDLGKLSALTGLALKGSAHVEAAVKGDPSRSAYAAEVSGQAQGFASHVAAPDGFLGAAPSLRGGIKLADGGYAFDKLALVGAGGRVLIDGAASELRAELEIPDAHRLDARVSGAASAHVKLAGSVADLDASLRDGKLLGRPAPRITLAAHGGMDGGKLTLDGELDGKPLQGALGGRRSDGVVTLDRVQFSLGRTKIDGAGRYANGLADGQLVIDAPKLDDLSPLALTPLSGALQANLTAASDAGRQDVAIRAKAASAAFGAVRIGGLSVDMRVADLYGDARPEGSAALERIEASGETVSGFRLTAKPEGLDLAATVRGLSLRAKGGLQAATRTLRLDSFAAKGRGTAIDLAAPTTLALKDGGVSLHNFGLRLGGGRLSLEGEAGRKLNLQAKAEGVPLSLADLASPGLGLAGKASGEARLTGDLTSPAGDWRIALTDLAAPASRNAGLPPIDARASGRLGGGRSSVDATITAGAAGSLKLNGSAPIKAGQPVALAAKGRLDVAPLTRLLAARGQRASGTVTLDAKLGGDLAHPQASGGANLSGGAFSDDASGFRVTELSASLAAHGDEVAIERLSGQTPGGGTISASGKVKIDAAAGFPGAIHIGAEKARLAATEIAIAEGGVAIDVSGPLAQSPRVSGRIDISALDVEVPGRLPGAAAPLADIKHIAPGPTARARIAHDERKKHGGAAFKAALALEVNAPSRVTAHGRGLDAEFGGQLQVRGSTVAPQIVGGFDLRRGTLTLIGGPMTFSRGRLSFEGDATPRLDMEARTALSDATAIIDVTGPADKPVFAFTSSPELPQDEILSRILFKKPSGNLSAFQALQLTNTVSALSGQGGAFDSVRRSLGVDSLDVTSNASGGPVVGARRAINDRLSLGVQTGAKPEDNGVSLDLDITKRLRLSTGVDAKGESKVGAGVQWEY